MSNLAIQASNFYTYYQECYKLDNKEFIIENVLSKKYPFPWFVAEKEEIYHENLPLITYTNKKVLELEKDLTLYKFENKLFYSCFFILGVNPNPLLSDDTRICAPLLLFPAEIETLDEEKFLRIDHQAFEINRSILSKLQLASEMLTKDDFVKELSALIQDARNNTVLFQRLFEKYFVNIDASELVLYPKVWTATRIKKHLAENQIQEDLFKIVPGAGTVLVKKSDASLKIIHDLEEMSKKNDFNHSISQLLGNVSKTFPLLESYFKIKLNAAQFEALQNASTQVNSVIVGPPGTGKSFTITAIVADAVVQNQSVLLVSKTKPAVEVLRNMLYENFNLKDQLVQTTGHSYKASLKSKIKKYLSGIKSKNLQRSDENEILLKFEQLNRLEGKFEKFIERELKFSDLKFSLDLSLFDKWRKFYLKSKTEKSDKLWKIIHSINRINRQLDIDVNLYTSLKILENNRKNIVKYREDLSFFLDALETSSFSEYKQILEKVDNSKILKIFPIWLAHLSELNAVLPLQKEMFDLVIIDEATQCDIASALPAIYRAKRVIIVGDPNQLRHYSFVSKEQQNNLLLKYNLPQDAIFDFRNKSILDVFISKVKQQNQVTFLHEHFRSTPSLIEFSNEHFYENQLEVLKSTPEFTGQSQIQLIHVDGNRNENGINELEAQAVLLKLDELIETYNNEEKAPSIGIISPFQTQVQYLNKLLEKKYDLETLKKFNLVSGTPYNFQGSEREIILLSFCVCNKTHPSAFHHLNKAEVMNVAITRAKSFQYVFKSVDIQTLKRETLLFKYFHFIEKFNHLDKSIFELDQFQIEVIEELQKNGFNSFKCGYPIAGNILDILVSFNNKNYFIDLIGYPGRYKSAFSLERYQTLSRTGIKTIPLHYSFWSKNKDEAFQKIKDFLLN